MFISKFSAAVILLMVWLILLAGLRFAGTKDGNAQELLYNYALYFLNEVRYSIPTQFISEKNAIEVHYIVICLLVLRLKIVPFIYLIIKIDQLGQIHYFNKLCIKILLFLCQ